MKLAIRNPFKKTKIIGDVYESRNPKPIVVVTPAQLAILFVLNTVGGQSTDANLVTAYRAMIDEGVELPVQSAGGIRTRRYELAKLGCVVEDGSFKTEAGRHAKLWSVTNCHVGIRPTTRT